MIPIVILKWFVDADIATAATRENKLIEEEHVECRPEKIPCSVLDENVDMVRHYFTNDAWMVVEDVVERKAKMDVWECSVCQHDLHDGRKSIVCESCLKWYHFTCVGLTKDPKRKVWFCKDFVVLNSSYLLLFQFQHHEF